MAIEQLLTKIGQIEVDKDVIDKGKYAADEIEKYISQDIICKTELLNEICKNPNLLWANTINQLIQNRILSVGDLINAHIDKRFIEALGTNLSARTISPSGELTQIKRLSTEVYFWGIPASGKSCAIGAILSMASKRGSPLVNAFAEQPCQGIDYMMQLCEMFLKDDKVKPVPSGTPVRFTYEMSFTITGPRPLLPAQCVCERSLCRPEPRRSSQASIPGNGSHSHFPDSLRADCNH